MSDQTTKRPYAATDEVFLTRLVGHVEGDCLDVYGFSTAQVRALVLAVLDGIAYEGCAVVKHESAETPRGSQQ